MIRQEEGVKRDCLFCYDLQLPPDFQPTPGVPCLIRSACISRLFRAVMAGQGLLLSCAFNSVPEAPAGLPLLGCFSSSCHARRTDTCLMWRLLQDSEVESFELLDVDAVAHTIASSDAFKDNCNLVIIDFLLRHGVLRPEQRGYGELVAGLRQEDCR